MAVWPEFWYRLRDHNFMSYFNPLYWLTLNPPELSAVWQQQIVFAVFALVVIVGLVFRYFARRARKQDKLIAKAWRKAGGAALTMGVLGLLLFFSSFEQVRFFGGRFWYPVWVIGAAVWAYLIVRFVRVEIPKRRGEYAARAQEMRYMR